jgi:hypothetical protein
VALVLISGIHDVLDGLRRANLCILLGWHDVRQRYCRFTLGQLWIMLVTTIFIGVRRSSTRDCPIRTSKGSYPSLRPGW